MSKKWTPLWREAHFEVKSVKNWWVRSTFGSWDVEKVHAVVARSTFRNQNVQNTHVRTTFGCFCAPCQKWSKSEGFVAFPKTMAGVRHLKRICKDAFSVAGAVQKTCSWEMLGGQGADFLRGVAFWSLRSSSLLNDFEWQVQHFVWPGITFSWQAQYFRQVEWRNRKTHWHEAVSSALNFSFLKEVPQNSFVFDVVNSENEEVSQNCFVFWRCHVQTLRKSRVIASFMMLSTLKHEEVSQNCFVFDVVKFKHWGNLAEMLRFWCCQLWKMKKSRRISWFSSL